MILNFSKYSVQEILRQHSKAFEEFIFIREFLEFWEENETISVTTSGSTGNPKTITFHKEALIQSATMTGKFLSLQQGNTALLCLPMQYIAAKMMVVRAIVLQLNLICISPTSSIIINEKIDFAAMTPMQAEKSLHSLHFIQKLILGGMHVSYELTKKLTQFPTQIFETFGMTETLSHFAMRNISQNEIYFKTLEKVEISLSAQNTLCVKIPFLSEKIITNDVVELVDNHCFVWKGRIDNVINSGGIKIFPEEIEQKLKPFIIDEFYITSEKDNTLGEKLVLQLEGNAQQYNYKKIFSKAKLTAYEIPKKIVWKSYFKRTESGKIIREKI